MKDDRLLQHVVPAVTVATDSLSVVEQRAVPAEAAEPNVECQCFTEYSVWGVTGYVCNRCRSAAGGNAPAHRRRTEDSQQP